MADLTQDQINAAAALTFQGVPKSQPAAAAQQPAQGGTVDPQLDALAQQYGAPSDVVHALLATEGTPDGRASPKGARSRMQVMPGTVQQYLGIDPATATDDQYAQAGVMKIADDYQHYNGDPQMTAAAYFAGRGNQNAGNGAFAYANGNGDKINDGRTTINQYVDRFSQKLKKYGDLGRQIRQGDQDVPPVYYAPQTNAGVSESNDVPAAPVKPVGLWEDAVRTAAPMAAGTFGMAADLVHGLTGSQTAEHVSQGIDKWSAGVEAGQSPEMQAAMKKPWLSDGSNAAWQDPRAWWGKFWQGSGAIASMIIPGSLVGKGAQAVMGVSKLAEAVTAATEASVAAQKASLATGAAADVAMAAAKDAGDAAFKEAAAKVGVTDTTLDAVKSQIGIANTLGQAAMNTTMTAADGANVAGHQVDALSDKQLLNSASYVTALKGYQSQGYTPEAAAEQARDDVKRAAQRDGALMAGTTDIIPSLFMGHVLAGVFNPSGMGATTRLANMGRAAAEAAPASGAEQWSVVHGGNWGTKENANPNQDEFEGANEAGVSGMVMAAPGVAMHGIHAPAPAAPTGIPGSPLTSAANAGQNQATGAQPAQPAQPSSPFGDPQLDQMHSAVGDFLSDRNNIQALAAKDPSFPGQAFHVWNNVINNPDLPMQTRANALQQAYGMLTRMPNFTMPPQQPQGSVAPGQQVANVAPSQAAPAAPQTPQGNTIEGQSQRVTDELPPPPPGGTPALPSPPQNGQLAAPPTHPALPAPETGNGFVGTPDGTIRASYQDEIGGPWGAASPQTIADSAAQRNAHLGLTPDVEAATAQYQNSAAAGRHDAIRQLVGQGFTGINRADDGTFTLDHPGTGQTFPLKTPADVQVARATLKKQVDTVAHTAATSPLNDTPQPTRAQIAAGNYKTGNVNIHGLNIAIENPEGSTRSGVSPEGKPWTSTLRSHYGYIRSGPNGADGDKVDAFIGPRPDSKKAYVVDQTDKTGQFDEHKIILGQTTEADARRAYLANYEPGWNGLGAITEMSMDKFKDWLKNGDTTLPVAYGKTAEELQRQPAGVNEPSDAGILPDGVKRAMARIARTPQGKWSSAGGQTASQDADHLEYVAFADKHRDNWRSPESKAIKHYGEFLRLQLEGETHANSTVQSTPVATSADQVRNTPTKAADGQRGATDAAGVQSGGDIPVVNEQPATHAAPGSAGGTEQTANHGGGANADRSWIRPHIESLIRHKREAWELKKDHQIDAVIAMAKKYMAGEEVKPARVKTYIGEFAPQEASEGKRATPGAPHLLAEVQAIYDRIKDEADAKKKAERSSGKSGKSTDKQNSFAASGTYSDGTPWTATYSAVRRTDGTYALTRIIHDVDEDGTRVEHLGKDGMWHKGQPATTAVFRPGDANTESGPEEFHTPEEALTMAKDDAESMGGQQTSTPANKSADKSADKTESQDSIQDLKDRITLAFEDSMEKNSSNGLAWTTGLEATAEKMYQAIVTRNAPMLEDILNPANPISRGAFEHLTNQKLPKTRTGTTDAINKFVGDIISKVAEKPPVAKPATNEADTPTVSPLTAARNDLMEMQARADAQGRVQDDRLLEKIRRQKGLIAELEQAPVAESATAEAEKPTVRNPTTLDEFYGDVDAGYHAHFDYDGEHGHTVWIEKTPNNGWVVKSKDDDSPAVVTKGGDPRAGGYSKAEAMAKAENDARHRFDAAIESGLPQGTIRSLTNRLGADSFSNNEVADIMKRQEAPEAKTEQFANNTLFTADKVAAARARMKAKLNNLNSGLDPELFQDGMTIAGAYIESGVRSFADFAHAMVADFGNSILPYLRSFYEGVRYYPNLDTAGMTAPADIDKTDINSYASAVKDEDTANEHSGNGATGEAALEGTRPSGVRRPGGGQGTGVRSPGSSEADTLGNGYADDGQLHDGDAGVGSGSGSLRPEQQRPEGLHTPEREGLEEESAPAEIADSVQHDTPASEPKSPILAGNNPGNYRITDEDDLGEGTRGNRIDDNLNAIRIVKQLEAEQRHATAEEQKALVKYVGWGGLKNVFDESSKKPQDQKALAELKRLLNEQEFFWAGQSVLWAHYTSKDIIGSMYNFLAHIGFRGGNTLEPTVGVGHFIGLMPEGMSATSKWHAAEIDPITSLIAKHLYPESRILTGTGFQKAEFPYGKFDLAIGNPPFGDERIADINPKRAAINRFKIHNYIIAKSGMHLKPGGVMAMVVTNRFLDTKDPEAREMLAKNFRLLGAVRLPNDAFAKSAGTEVTTDLVFMQKVLPGEKAEANPDWLETGAKMTNTKGEEVTLNRYFANRPHLMLGEPSMQGTMYGSGEQFTLNARPGQDTKALFNDLLQGEFAPLHDQLSTQRNQVSDATPSNIEANREDVAVGGYITEGNNTFMRIDDDANGNVQFAHLTPKTVWSDSLVPNGEGGYTRAVVKDGVKSTVNYRNDADVPDNLRLGEARLARINDMLRMRDKAYALIRAERADASNIEALRNQLNDQYDAFVKEHGFINDPANAALMADDVRIESGLEMNYRKAVTAARAKTLKTKASPAKADKAALLTQRVFFPYRDIIHADSPTDGYSISLSEKGKLDLNYISDLTGKRIDDVIAELSSGEKPYIFKDPETGEWRQEDQYLSGNVKAKLAAVDGKPGFEKNAEALRKAQPADVPYQDIFVDMGATWVPADKYEDFMRMLGVNEPRVNISDTTGAVSVTHYDGTELNQFSTELKNDDYNIIDLFNKLANKQPVVAYDHVIDENGDQKRVVNKERTKAFAPIAKKLNQLFKDWIFADESRALELEKRYNDTQNTTVDRKYDGKYLRMVGSDPKFEMRDTQRNGAWRMMQSTSVLLDHAVGAGKTATFITGIMERRRLGLSRKPMVVVPNHIVGQWAKEWLSLYPGANILAATEKDFSKPNRRRLFSRIATGNYDAVIVGHSSFGFIPVDTETENNFVMAEVEHLQNAMADADQAGDKRTVRTLKNRVAKRMERIAKLKNKPRDNVATFEDMGIDHLSIDESQEFKNLEYSTAMGSMAGMGTPGGSKRAFDLYMKLQTMFARGGAATFGTGTPISNSLVEMYSLMRYLNRTGLQERGLEAFDAWAKNYAGIESRIEYTAAQKLKERTVMASFNNIPEMLQLYNQFADSVTMKDLKAAYALQMRRQNEKDGTHLSEDFPVPKVIDGGRKLDTSDPSEEQREYMDYLVARAEAMEKAGKGSDPRIDNMLWLMNDARKMALDMRLVDPLASDYPDNKINRAARMIKGYYDQWNADRGTQLVFCDLSTPTKNAAKDARQFIKTALTKIGMDKDAGIKNLMERMTWQEKWSYLRNRMEDLVGREDTPDDRRESLEEFLDKGNEAEGALITADVGFSVYDDLKQKLVAMGIPEGEVRFIHEANSRDQKTELFDQVNAGAVRVMLGSSPKMGAGTNVQERLVAEHHMDSPWRPSDVEQREGRIIRQKNSLYMRDPTGFKVGIHAYSTNQTFDAVMWQILARKAAMIEGFRSGKRSVEDGDSDAAGYANFMAETTGNPIFKEKIRLENDISELEATERRVRTQRHAAERTLQMGEEDKARATRRIDVATDETEAAKPEGMTVDGKFVPDDADTVISEEQAKYQQEYAQFTQDFAQFSADMAQHEAAPETIPKPKRPKEPQRPSISSERVVNRSAQARAITDIAGSLHKLGDGESLSIKVGDLKLTFGKEVSQDNKKAASYDVESPQKTISLDSHNYLEAPINFVSQVLMGARRYLADAKSAAIKTLERTNAGVERAHTILENMSFKDADALAQKKARYEAVIGEVNTIEAEMNATRSQRVNKFINGDGKRFPSGDVREVPAAPVNLGQYHYRIVGGNTEVVAKTSKVEIPDLSGHTFYAYQGQDKAWHVVEDRTGLALSHGQTKSEAIQTANDTVARMGIDKVADIIAKATAITDEQKTAAVSAYQKANTSMESRAAMQESALTNSTPAQIRDAFVKAFGEKSIRQLEQNGLVSIVATAADLPAGVHVSNTAKAVFAGNKAYFVADRMDAATGHVELLHEIGEHYGLEAMLGEAGYKALTRRIADLAKDGDPHAAAAWSFVRANYPELAEGGENFMHEVLAQLGQNADITPMSWFQNVVAAVKRFLISNGFTGMIRVADLQDMVLHSLKTVAGDNGPGPNGGKTKAIDIHSASFKNWFGDWENGNQWSDVRQESLDGKARQGQDNGRTASALQGNSRLPGTGLVNRDGTPALFFHGTADDVAAFDLNHPNRKDFGWLGRGVYATSSRFAAEQYALMKGRRGGNAAPNVMRVYVAVKNPFITDPSIKQRTRWYTQDEIDTVTDRLKAAGHDGVLVEYPDGAQEVVAFNPGDVKSAISNIGNFDATNPNIQESRGNYAETAAGLAAQAKAKVKASEAMQWADEAIDGIKRAFVPQDRSADAKEISRLIIEQQGAKEYGGVRFRAELGKVITKQRDNLTAAEKFRALLEKGLTTAADALFVGKPKEDNYAFIDAFEHDDQEYFKAHPEMKKMADLISKMFDEKVELVRKLGTGALQNVLENYFPHIWKQMPDDAQRQIFSMLSKRPFEGGKGFTKQRVFEDFMAGINAGYEPISNNPLDIVMLKMEEMDKYILAHQVLKTIESAEDSDAVQLIPAGDTTPKGFTDINGRYGSIERDGQKLRYIGQDDVAQVLNNYLSESLYHNKYVGKLATGYMKAANFLNLMQLGLGAFHAGFTSIEAVISHAALGIKAFSHGDMKGAAKYLGEAPMAWLNNPKMGSKIIKELLHGGTHPEMAQIIEGLQLAGFKYQLDNRFRTDATKKMLEAWGEGDKATAGFHALGAIVEQSARPIMEWLVPRQKFGVFGEMYNKWLQDNPGASPQARRNSAQQIWNRVDSRLGQVVYDRLFMHNVTKNFAQMLIRAPGWTGGTILEVGGGIKDLATYAKNLATGKPAGGLTDRAAYTLSMLLVTALSNAILTALFTGGSPDDWKDLVAFRTGNLDEHGRAERFMLPTYAKDLYNYIQHPVDTLSSKTHPVMSLASDVARNRQFDGTEIRSADDNILTQMAQTGSFVAKAFVPFFFKGIEKEVSRGGSAAALAAPMIGIMPAASNFNQSAAERLMTEYTAERMPGTRTQAETDRSHLKNQMYSAIRKGDRETAMDIFRQGRADGILTNKDFAEASRSSQQDPLVHQFSHLSYAQAQRVMNVATDAEQAQLAPLLAHKKALVVKSGLAVD